jgi:SAM-dependent methyltransferase
LDVKEPILTSLHLRDERGGRDELDVKDVVAQEKRLIISGASGMGKTTALKWLTLVYAENYLEGAERLIPLYVDLGRFRHGLFYDHALMIAHENGLMGDDFKELLYDVKLVIFLDGLDLLGGSEDFEPVAEIQNFMSEFSRCKFVLSSRPGFFDGFKSSCKVSELVELDDPKIKGYIHKYLGEGGKADTLISRIFDSRNERLKLLCKNPMMLHLVIWLQKDGRMVDGRAGIYRESVEGIITHYREKGKALSSNGQLVRDVLKELAFSMQKENTIRLDYGGALYIAGSCISPERYRRVSAEHVLEDCFGLGLLHKGGDEVRFGFHQSFQEYFAAVKLEEIFEQGYDISESFSHPNWENVLIFLSEITERPDELFDDVIVAGGVFLAAKLTLCVGDSRVENLCALLLDMVDGESDLERNMAVKSFTYIGNRATEPLMELYVKDESIVRSLAAAALVDTLHGDDLFAQAMMAVQAVPGMIGSIQTQLYLSLSKLYYLAKQEKIKIFKELKEKPDPTEVKSDYNTPSGVKYAEEMLTDAHLGALLDRLKFVPDSITVVDYGCGKGAFLGRMKEIERELGKIHYIGVDISRGNRYLAGITAKRCGVANKLKSYDFMKPDEFFSKNIDIDHVFFSHVIHEIFLKYLPEILYHLLSKMKAGSRITILEQVILLEPERDFVTWSADDFDILFSDFAEVSSRPYKTGHGHELISVDLERLNTDVSLESIRKRCLEVYEHKKERALEKLGSHDLSDDEHRYQTALLANICSQMNEYQKSMNG